MYSRTGFAFNAVLGLLQQGDKGGAAGLGLGELDSGLYLGQHGTFGELALLNVNLCLSGGQVVQTLLIGLVEVDGDLFYGSEDDQHIGIQLLGQ